MFTEEHIGLTNWSENIWSSDRDKELNQSQGIPKVDMDKDPNLTRISRQQKRMMES